MTTAVAGAVAGASITVNAASGTISEFGNAGAMIRLDATDPAAAQAAIAEAKRRYGTVEVIGHRRLAVPGSVESLDVRTQDPNGVFGHPLLALRTGRYPTAPGEVGLSDGAADRLDVGIGSHLAIGDVQRTVVGLVENPLDLNDEFALLAPTDPTSAESLTLLLGSSNRLSVSNSAPTAAPTADGPAGPTAPQPGPQPGDAPVGGFDVMVAGSVGGVVNVVVLAATTLAMALVCLIATAGFLVVAQHRQRQLGMLAALGATEGHLRLVMLADGMIVGGIAAVIGAALGVLGWTAVAPAVETAAAHRIGRFDLPWHLIAGCMGIAVVAAIAAAWWPARTVARMPVMAALSTRPGHPAPARRSLVVAMALTALGMVAIVVADPVSTHVRPVILVVGLLAVVVGVVLGAPAAIGSLRVPARRCRLAPRLALRDLVRYQARAAAALAAITLGLGLSVVAVVVATANVYGTDEGNLSDRQILIHAGAESGTPHRDDTTPAPHQLDTGARRIAAAVGHPSLFALDMALRASTAGGATVQLPVSVARATADRRYEGVSPAFVATPELLSRYGIDLNDVDADAELLTSITGDLVLLDPTARPGPTHVEQHAFPSYGSAPHALITQHAMDVRGWVAARHGWLIETSKPLTSTQVKAARAAAAQAGLTIETRSSQDGLAALRRVATIVGTLLALAVVAMTVGLIRGESAGDLRTLTATGADPRTRRALTATTAGALALLGALLGTAGAYAGLVAAYHGDLAQLAPPPIVNLIALIVGLPMAATAAGWLLAGREPRTFARQILD